MNAPAGPHMRRSHHRGRRGRSHRPGILERLSWLLRSLVSDAARRSPNRHRSRAADHVPAAHSDHARGSHARSRGGGEGTGAAVINLSRRQVGAIVLLALAGGWLAFRIVSDTAGQKAAIVKPDVALAWNSAEPKAMDELARQCLVGNGRARSAGAPRADSRSGAKTAANSAAPACDDLDRAETLARRALQQNPLDARALTLLGLIADRKGDAARANRLMRTAGARSWRDPMTQAWLFSEKIKQRDFAGALTHADAILRTTRDFDERIFPSLASFTLSPPALQALVTRLRADPPWRGWLLSELSARLADDTRLLQLYRALRDGTTPPDTTELKPLFTRLIKDRRFDDAHRFWQDTLPPQRRNSGRYPYNADFSQAPSGLPFDWILQSMPGADIAIVPLDEGEGRAVQIQFSGARVNFQNVYQLMTLPPGDYRLSGKMKAEDLQTRRGLRWRVTCADAFPLAMPRGLATLGHSPLLATSVPWRNFGMEFSVPRGCPAQWLALELAARIEPETQIEGEVWYTGLRVAPVAKEDHGPMCLAPDIED